MVDFIAGSHTAFEQLYNRYSPAIYANIYKAVRRPDLAEDILQDVFTVLWTNRSKIDPAQSIANWLFVVSYHRSLACLTASKHSSKSSKNRPSTLSAPILPPPSLSPASTAPPSVAAPTAHSSTSSPPATPLVFCFPLSFSDIVVG